MKKYITHTFTSLAIFSLTIFFSTSVQSVRAQTTTSDIMCPAGYTCKPLQAQPENCPAGYICTLISYPSTPVIPAAPILVKPTCHSFSTDLRVNDSGSDVVELQTQLISNKFDIPAISSGNTSKGYIGSQTVSAIRKYQQSKGLAVTGILDSSTRQEINSSLDSLGCVKPPTPIGGVSEQVRCVFNGSSNQEKCYTSADNPSLNFNCSGIGACVANVKGQSGTQLTWKSPCGGGILPITTIDGNNKDVNFTCSATTLPSITILSPNGGEKYKNNGSPITVNWQTTNISSSQILDVIRLRAYLGDQEYNLAYNVRNDGQEVVVPSSVPVGAYTLEIKSNVNGTTVMDSSDSYFKIIDSEISDAPIPMDGLASSTKKYITR